MQRDESDKKKIFPALLKRCPGWNKSKSLRVSFSLSVLGNTPLNCQNRPRIRRARLLLNILSAWGMALPLSFVVPDSEFGVINLGGKDH